MGRQPATSTLKNHVDMAINLSSLDAKVQELGLLIGLLSEEQSVVSIDKTWFNNTQTRLEATDTRLQYLVELLDTLLGPASAVPAGMPANFHWYQLPNPQAATGTTAKLPLYLVASPPAAAGQMGFGLEASTEGANFTLALSLNMPCLAYDTSGAHFVAGAANYPCQLSLSLTKVGGFQAGSVSFSGVSVVGSFFFNGTAPSLTLTFEGLTGAGSQATSSYTTLSELSSALPLAWLAAVVAPGVGTWLDTAIGSSSVTPGIILVAAGLLAKNSTGSYAVSGSSWLNPSAIAIAEHFIFSLLDSFAAATPPALLMTLPGGGLSVCHRTEAADSSVDYGLRLQSTLGLGSWVSLCLGAELTGQTQTNDWLTDSGQSAGALFPDPGISLYLLNAKPAPTAADPALTYSFAPDLILANVGLNVNGANKQALIDLGGYTLQGFELRAALALRADAQGNKAWVYGVAARLDDLGIPLGPGFGAAVSGSDTNPVAKSLVSSGSGSGSGDQDPINPAFSISAAYVKNGKLAVQLYDKDGKATDVVTLPIHRALGPLQCEKVGVGWLPDATTPKLSVLFDGGVRLDVLDISLDGLSIDIPVTTPGDFSGYSMDLAGLGLSFSAGEVALSGAFVKLPPTPTRTYPEYDGSVLITGGGFSLSALGSYAYATDPNDQNGFASLFIFGMLDGNVGGPAFFYVTGLAVGFGYNRQINLPDMNSVTDFPFLKVFDDPSSLLGTGPATSQPSPLTVLAHMDSYVPPQRGEYWLAAGVRFTSFDLVHTTALLTVEFGRELEIGLLGITRLSLPPAAPGSSTPTYLYAELGIEVVVLPDQGFVGATALLTPNSYVIDPACKLTGGLAFYSWFGNNPHANEFVLTIGGYYPSFTPPGYYPSVPRLAFNWPVSDSVNISGDAYFALTPSAAMAGAGLNITYNDGDLHAWFNAQMDALIVWAPFQYLIDIQVNLGASYRLNLRFTTVTLKVELGASLTIWGPAMGGRAHISWYVISFTVGFGADAPAPAGYLLWTNNGTGFSETLLPHATMGGAVTPAQLSPMAALVGQRALTAAVPVPVPPSGIHAITISSGLLSTYLDTNQQTVWVVRPNHLCLGISTAIPATDIASVSMLNPLAPTVPLVPVSSPARLISIRPMGVTLNTSTLSIGLTLIDGVDTTDQVFDKTFQFTPTLGKVPASKWGSPLVTTGTPEPNAMIDGQLLGLENIMLCPTTLSPIGSNLLLVDITTAFVDLPVTNGLLPVSGTATPTGLVPTQDPQWSQHMAASLLATADTRTTVFESLRADFGIDAGTNGLVTTLAGNPGFYLTGQPLIYAG
jgi:hypothetical protein